MRKNVYKEMTGLNTVANLVAVKHHKPKEKKD